MVPPLSDTLCIAYSSLHILPLLCVVVCYMLLYVSQVTCEGDQLQVIKRDKFWGQGNTILGAAGPEEYSVPLGELEFLLDRNKK